jgi:hypothetical protein
MAEVDGERALRIAESLQRDCERLLRMAESVAEGAEMPRYHFCDYVIGYFSDLPLRAKELRSAKTKERGVK